jgi:hypothetical protein
VDKDTHVYCTDCIRGQDLLEGIMFYNTHDIPKECKECNPFDPEDSRAFELRKNYVSLYSEWLKKPIQ